MSRKSAQITEEEAIRAAEESMQRQFDPLGNPNEPSSLSKEELEFWIKSRGWTPAEFLTHVYRNGFAKMEHRISAAKAMLEYAHRKMPTKLEAEVVGRGMTIDATALSKLSDKELETLEKILTKVGG